MRVKVLGSGNAFHGEGRFHSSFIVDAPDAGPLLVDAGATVPVAMERMGLGDEAIRAVLVTHFHADHLFGLPFLLLSWSEIARRETPLEIAGPPGIEERCRALVALAYPTFECRFPVRYVEVGSGSFPLAGFSVTPRRVTHAPESHGYAIRSPAGRTLAVSGDAAFDERLVGLVQGADLALVELTLAEPAAGRATHVSVRELVERRDELDVARLVFVHTEDRVAREAVRLGIGELANDGAILEV